MCFKGFNERPFFDGYDREERGGGRGGGNMNDIRGGGRTGGGRERPSWGDREDERAPSNHFEKGKPDKERDNGKRATSRWTNSSPKSVVSDEENWDDLEDSDKPEEPKPTNTIEKTMRPVTVPQTEPIDDDSQEDDFNDFDDSSPLPTSDEILPATPATPAKSDSPQRTNIEADNEDIPAMNETPATDCRESPPATSINMFSDDIPPVEAVNSPESNDKFAEVRPTKTDTGNCENTTPLYDEPHQENRQNNQHVEHTKSPPGKDSESDRPMSPDDEISPTDDSDHVIEDMHEIEQPSYDKNDEAQRACSRSQSPASPSEARPTSQSPPTTSPLPELTSSEVTNDDDTEVRSDE